MITANWVSDDITILNNATGPYDTFICGDVNNDELVNLLDIVYIIEFLYSDGISPVPYDSGDVNNSGSINLLDITYLIGYLYQGGPDPDCP